MNFFVIINLRKLFKLILSLIYDEHIKQIELFYEFVVDCNIYYKYVN